jgi:dCTP deaminase
MSFWSCKTTRSRILESQSIDPPLKISQGALELRLGPEAAISNDDPKITRLKEREEVKIPPGQVALLLTEEKVKLPGDALGLISLKTKIKSQGLINISGFHVDPGYCGRLKFWVYNAGNLPVIVKRGDYCFTVWFSGLDGPVDTLYHNKDGQDEITSEDLNKMRGTLHSPAALAEKVKNIEDLLNRTKIVLVTLLSILVGVLVKVAFDKTSASTPIPSPQALGSPIPIPSWTEPPPIKIKATLLGPIIPEDTQRSN